MEVLITPTITNSITTHANRTVAGRETALKTDFLFGQGYPNYRLAFKTSYSMKKY